MSTPEATASLLEAMAKLGLYPPEVKWTGDWERFTYPHDGKKNDKGWLIAHDDAPEGAGFGVWGTSIKGTWFNKPNHAGETYTPEQKKKDEATRRRRKKDWAKKMERQYAAAARRCVTKWNNAKSRPAQDNHPYLLSKGISGAGLRQERGTLMIPMKHVVTGKMVSLQFITQAGQKRFAKDTTVKGARTSLGLASLKKTKTPILYVTEGFATGRTIHDVTGLAVIIAFSKDNLLPVCKALRQQYPNAVLVICADNDRFSVDAGVLNPGVVAAHKVAAECDAVVAIPDFENVKPGMTDFNDVMLHDGPEKVAYWLQPEHASEAIIIDGDPPPPVEVGPEPEAPPPTLDVDALKPKTWRDTAPFQCLGYDHDMYYYLPTGKGQITGLTARSHREESLQTIAPLMWWEAEFPGGKTANWSVARDGLFRASERSGVYRPERLRGRGCWLEDATKTGVIIHLGDRVLPPDQKTFLKPEKYVCPKGRIYERQPRLEGPSEERALDLAGAKKVLEAFRGLLWHDDASGVLLAGWTVLAPICGALKWRPHVWIVGGAGSGKTEVLQRLVRPLLGGAREDGGMNQSYDGGTTEAGIRQELRADALPVLYDEAEKTDMKSDSRLQNILGLARSASSSAGSHTAKGTTHGTAMSFQVRSMFCLASIGGAIRQEADKTRISLLQLQSTEAVGKKVRREHWRSYSPLLETITIQVGRELMARSISWLRNGSLAETLKIFRLAASGVLGDARAGDQYGTLYGGAWTLMSDHPPTAQDARDLIGSEDLTDYISEQVPEGKKALQTLLQHRELVATSSGPKMLALGRLVDILAGGTGPASHDEATEFLKQVGLRVDTIDGAYYLFVATSSERIKKALADTPYGDNINTALRTLAGVGPGGKTRFHTGFVSHTTRVPFSILLDYGEDDDDA